MTINPPDRLVTLIKKNLLFFKKDAQIVFVCGKDIKAHGSKRKIILEYARRNTPNIHLLLAEDFFNELEDKNTDILTIEKKLSEYSDCILIILESESAFCELGAFAVDDCLSKKMLIINDKKFKNSPSFINYGPIKKIETNKYDFAGILYVDMESILSCAKDLKECFQKLINPRGVRTNFNEFVELEQNVKGRMLFLCDIVSLLSPVSHKELIAFLTLIYGKKNFKFLKTDLNILISLKLLIRKEQYYIRNKSGIHFLRLNFTDEIKLRSQMTIEYKKKDPSRLQLLEKAYEETA